MAGLADERGETLIELLVTIIVMGIGLVGIVGAMGGSILAAEAHRSLSVAEVITQDFGVAVKDAASSTSSFVLCPGAEQLTPTGYTPPTGWHATITKVEWWIPDPLSHGTFSESNADCLAHASGLAGVCPTSVEPECDPGLQRVTIAVYNERTDVAAVTPAEPVESRILVRRGNGS